QTSAKKNPRRSARSAGDCFPQIAQLDCPNLRRKTMTENDISFIIRGAIFKVFNALGPGLLESAYEAALMHELIKAGLNVKAQVPLPLIYDEIKMDVGYRIDLLVENKVIVEIKSIENLSEVHHKQVLTYLKLSAMKLGILVNFNCVEIEKSIFRKANGL
ncbi:GxxExxY protein, partial [Lunatibacter salilacus]|uniref:GxxExxY protein n=1 Tax=Lunatibacter salilacus TaxID=2483804 RepID=UPI00293BC942